MYNFYVLGTEQLNHGVLRSFCQEGEGSGGTGILLSWVAREAAQHSCFCEMGSSSTDWVLSRKALLLTTAFQHHSDKTKNAKPTGRVWEPKKIQRESIQVKRSGISHHFPDQAGGKQSPDSEGETNMEIHT